MPTNREIHGLWDEAALQQLHQWDAAWAQAYYRMSTSFWSSGARSRKFVELLGVALNAACTNLDTGGTRRHIRAALDAGATREEILFVLKCGSVMSIHSCSLGAPILLEEAEAIQPSAKPAPAAPSVDKMKAIGQWNDTWNPLLPGRFALGR